MIDLKNKSKEIFDPYRGYYEVMGSDDEITDLMNKLHISKKKKSKSKKSKKIYKKIKKLPKKNNINELIKKVKLIKI